MIIFHVDLDAFFAAVEERDHPEYRGKPVIVGGKPEDGRGVVATCNYSAREYGLHSAMPISRAYKLCPNGIYVRPRFKEYVETSRRVMSILQSYAENFQQVSIDEAYLTLTTDDARGAAEEIQQRILDEEKLSCSIGAGSNKHVAKIASDFKKPSGITIVPTGEEESFLAPLPVRKLLGVGPKTEEKLKKQNIRTVADIKKLGEAAMTKLLGSTGAYLYHAACGEGSTNVSPRTGAKSISKNRTFFKDTNDRDEIQNALTEMVELVHERMLRHGYWCKTMGVRVRFSNFETYTRDWSIELPTQSITTLHAAVTKLMHPFLEDSRKIRLVGVRVSGLSTPTVPQKTLDAFSK